MIIFGQNVVLGVIFIILLYVEDGESACDNTDNLEVAKLDSKWIDTRRLDDRWYVSLSSKLDAWYPPYWNSNPPLPMTPKTPARRCWDASILTPRGRVHAPFVCGFSKHELQNCVLRTEETRLKRKLRLAGDFLISKSDNATYFLMLGCIENDKKFWFVMSRPRKLSQNVTEEILEHVAKMGFDREDLSDKYDDRFALHKLRSTKCRRQDYPDYDGTEEEEKRLAMMGNSTGKGVDQTTEKSSDADDDKDDNFISSLIKTVKKILVNKKD